MRMVRSNHRGRLDGIFAVAEIRRAAPFHRLCCQRGALSHALVPNGVAATSLLICTVVNRRWKMGQLVMKLNNSILP